MTNAANTTRRPLTARQQEALDALRAALPAGTDHFGIMHSPGYNRGLIVTYAADGSTLQHTVRFETAGPLHPLVSMFAAWCKKGAVVQSNTDKGAIYRLAA